MASIKKSPQKRPDSQRIEMQTTCRKDTRSTKKKSNLISDKKDGSNEVVLSEENDSGNDGEVQCFCNNKTESGKMVQCEVCAG